MMSGTSSNPNIYSNFYRSDTNTTLSPTFVDTNLNSKFADTFKKVSDIKDKNRLSTLGRSPYGPKKLHRKI